MTTTQIEGGRRSLRGAAFRRATWKWSVGWFIAKVLLILIAYVVLTVLADGADGWIDLTVH